MTHSRSESSDPLTQLDAASLFDSAVAVTPRAQALAPLFPAYEIGKLLGEGGSGSVFVARHRKLGRTVALKVLHGELAGDAAFVARFTAEARAMSRVEHPFIATVLDYGDVEGVHFLILEHCSGGTLRHLLAGAESDPAPGLLALSRVADAVAAAHREGVVHRDLKPENVLLDASGYPRVVDFGLARSHEPGTPRMTVSGDVLGTPHYMAPEQVAGRPASSAADVYALSVIGYELLAGQLPIGRFPSPSDAPQFQELSSCILRGLDVDPDARPSLVELGGALQRAATSSVSAVAAPNAENGAQSARADSDLAESDRERPERAALLEERKSPAKIARRAAGWLAVVAVFSPWLRVGILDGSHLWDISWTNRILPLPLWPLIPLVVADVACFELAAYRSGFRAPAWLASTAAVAGLVVAAAVAVSVGVSVDAVLEPGATLALITFGVLFALDLQGRVATRRAEHRASRMQRAKQRGKRVTSRTRP